MTGDWLRGIGADLRHVMVEITRLAAEVAVDWRDARGQEWIERAGLVGRELGRQADASDELAATAGRLAEEDRPAGSTAEGRDRTGGPRLGGTEGHRAAEGHGVRIPTLPPPPGANG
ncbi:MAG TPA: hypothetical protein VD813_07585 [Pseudonocardia sp.]|nr:hypothetical protein [Pseudonocardia sp.]